MTELETIIQFWQVALDDYRPIMSVSSEYFLAATIKLLKELQGLKGEPK